MTAIRKKLEQAHDKARRKQGATGTRRGKHKVAEAGKVDRETAEALAWLFNMKL